MNWPRLILGSVALNLALVGMLLFQTARQRAAALPETRLTVVTNLVATTAPEPARAPVVQVPGSPPFHWSQIESTNILVVATNLLAIGCPPETALDLLEARLADDLRARVQELLRPFNTRFWELAASTGDFESLLKGSETEQTTGLWTRQHDELQKSLRQMLAAPAEKRAPSPRNARYGHLAAEKQTQVAELETRHEQELGKLRKTLAQLSATERAAKQKELRDRHQAERAGLLTTEELDEAELRRSPQAAKVRELRGFSATPTELRSLALTLRNFDTANPAPPRPDPARAEDKADFEAKSSALEARRRALLLAQLGEQRLATFERGSDPRFHTLLKLARRLEAPAAAASQWLALQTTAQDQAARTRQDAQLSPEARAVALVAIRAATEQELRAAVGARGWGAYQRHAGDWLKQLGQ
ncbi:MAG: hypothetical protein RLZZ265_3216 [Verrucomicrobiota bacterium]